MKIAFFNSKPYDRQFLEKANQTWGHEIDFLDVHLNVNTVKLAKGYPVICAFVNDDLNARVVQTLAEGGTRLIALRCAGFNNVDLKAALEAGITVVRVPAYSPHGVAEHAVALMLALNRKIYRAHNRIRDGNFSLDGLLGFEMAGKTAGILGTGRIGSIAAGILKGFGMTVLAYDPYPREDLEKEGIAYVGLDEIYSRSDIISLHMPLQLETYHIINKAALSKMKDGVMIINTSRGALIDTQAVIEGLKSKKIGYLGLDVYEEEEELFFEDLSGQVIQDDTFARLMTFPNVIITGHQAFFTREALQNIADTTLKNVHDFESGTLDPHNCVTLDKFKGRH